MPAVGAAGVALIDAAFPGQTAEAIKARETALRWMVRGLVTRSWPFARSRSNWRCRRTGDRIAPRERFGRASAIVRKGATRVETSSARASPRCGTSSRYKGMLNTTRGQVIEEHTPKILLSVVCRI